MGFVVMQPRQILWRSLTFYWRTNVAVVLGVATAVSVLAGALLVGDSVRGSLRDLLLGRLGHTDQVVVSTNLFREDLAHDLAQLPEFTAGFSGVTPLIVAQGMVTAQNEGRRIAQARVYGVDDRFWSFHGVAGVTGPENRDAFLSPALAQQIGAATGDAILVRVQRPTDVPLESLHGQRDNAGRSLRLTIAKVVPADSLGEFSLEAQQGDVAAVFVPLTRLQQDLEIPGRVNTILVSTGLSPPVDAAAALRALVRREAGLEDLGFLVETADSPDVLVVGSPAGLLDDAHAKAAMSALEGASLQAGALFTYLANSIRIGEREIPYSLVTALDLRTFQPVFRPTPAPESDGPIVLNEWAATELQARTGDPVTLQYYAWEEPGRLATKTATLTVAGVVPIDRGDRQMAPTYPGITDSPTLDDWDPPFPVDLRRIRPVDEAYWKKYRTTPKAFVPLEVGQRLWQTRYGSMTSIRIHPAAGQSLSGIRDRYAQRLRAAADPFALGLGVIDVRARGLEASHGATDFGEYFVYFSFFIVVSALLLVALFFKLGIEQRVREVGLLRAVGFGPARVRSLFLQEGALLAVVGSALGVAGALAYAWVMMYGLRSWWVDAVGTTALAVHVSPASLAGGVIGGVLAAIACIWWTLRALSRISERSLLMGTIEDPQLLDSQSVSGPRAGLRRWKWPMATLTLAVFALLLLAGAAAGIVERAAAFFGAGSALLVSSLCGIAWLLRRRSRRGIDGHGWMSVSRLGMRTATYRPARSVLSIAVIASATFILVSVEAFRRGDRLADSGPHSGVGGYDLIVETLLPIVRDPNTREGRDALNVFDLPEGIAFEPLRVLPGDDASCLNLYQPVNPRIVAASESFVREGRFAFQGSLAATDAERANPWLLLERVEPDGAIPVIADANSMTYVLHKKLGEDVVIARGDGQVRLRLVAALSDSIFQGELLMAEQPFSTLFPEQQGYRLLLVRAGNEPVDRLEASLESGMADFGARVTGTAERLAQFHRVENTYLSTFQTLGGLGLMLGTFGLATVLLRNVLERKRELALLGAVGFRRGHVMTMVVAENVLLLVSGLAAGALSAALAITPAAAERGSHLPFTSGSALLMAAVLVTGLLSSVLAMRAATRLPLLASLRSE
jgi:putative ABC transport system permease protein